MSRTPFYLVSLLSLFLGVGCVTAPPGEGGSAASPVPEAPPGPRPEATLQRPELPPEEAIDLALHSPDALRFDAGKKAALQKRKPTIALRRVPLGTLSEPDGRQAPLALSDQELPSPVPPPQAPELTPVIPDDDRAGASGNAGSFVGEVEPARDAQSDGGGGGASTAAGEGASRMAAREPVAQSSSGGDDPPRERGSQRAPVSTDPPAAPEGTESSRSGPEESEESREAAPNEPGEMPRSRAPSEKGAGESYPYQLTETRERAENTVGEELLVRLPGEGWLYLGEEGQSEHVRFLSQREQQGETLFRFRIGRPGEYELQFQRQELFSGRVAEHILQVAASDGSSNRSRQEAAGRLAEDTGGVAGDGVPGETALDHGEAEGAVGELRWPEEFATEALLENPQETLRRTRESEKYDAVSLAEMIARRGDARGAIRLLEAYQGEEEREVELDEVWFRMAQLLEKEAQARDLRRSVALYERIVDEYPLSDYYEASRQRAEHLKRHFFLVR